jgi:hypothetical protein
MSKLHFLSLCALPLAVACDDGPASITVSTGRAPEAIAFRDGLDGEWQVLTPTAAGSYTLEANGPYVVSVVCDVAGLYITTRQIARTPDDDRALDLKCPTLPMVTSSVVGTVVQPGYLNLGGILDFSDTPDWDITFASPAGTFDLIGVSSDRIAIRRDLAIAGTVDLGTINLDQEGVRLVPSALTVANKLAAETIEAQVLVTTPGAEQGIVHLGSPASAKVAPSEILNERVRQSVTMVAWGDDQSRSVRRDFHAGDPTAFTLPEPLGAVQFETATGELVSTWSTLPAHDKIVLSVYGNLANGTGREHELELSRHFADATGATSATLDTDFPGAQAAWRLDFAREYQREIRVIRDHEGAHFESDAFTTVNADPEARSASRTRGLPRTSPGKQRLAR